MDGKLINNASIKLYPKEYILEKFEITCFGQFKCVATKELNAEQHKYLILVTNAKGKLHNTAWETCIMNYMQISLSLNLLYSILVTSTVWAKDTSWTQSENSKTKTITT